MKPFIMIEKNFSYSPSEGHEIVYYSITNSKTNKNWIVQYNTTLKELIHYAIGYAEALDFDHKIYFSENMYQDLNSNGYPELILNILTESDFQNKRKVS